MVAEMKNFTYIVAGDEMAYLMKRKHPHRKIIPFCEDLSMGSYSGFSVDGEFVSRRAAFWGVPEAEYERKLHPVISLDLTEKIVLCFGEDACCRANLAFVVGYLRGRGYDKPLTVQIVDEHSLALLREYTE